MRVIVVSDYEKMSERAFELVKDVVCTKPDAVLGLATGSTPLGLYRRMVADHAAHATSYRAVRTVNLDEYAGLPADHEQSYAYFMRTNLFEGIDILPQNTYIENGMAEDAAAECARYDALLQSLRQDLQLLGIGSNGHIAFNEPGTPFDMTTHVVSLAESTIRDNARLFAREEDVPRRAFTMGPANIMNASRILVLANGANKARAVYGMVRGEVTPSLPASILQRHADCTLICDAAAAALIRGE